MYKKYFLYLLLLIPLSAVSIFYFFHFKYTSNIPVLDDYDAVIYFLSSFIDSDSLLSKLKWLFVQHREHRYVFPRLFFLAYYYIIGEINFQVIILFGHLALIGTFILLIRSINFENTKDRFTKFLVIISITILFFQFQYWEGSAWALASFFIYFGLLFSFLSLLFLSRSNLVLAIILSVMAAFTAGNGLLTIPVGLFILYSTNKFSKQFFIWLVFGIVIFGIYFWNYSTPADQVSLSQNIFQNHHKVILFFLSYAGSVFLQIPYGSLISILAGVIILIAIIHLFFRKYYLKNPFVFGIILFLIITMFLNSVSRFEVGFISRYTIFSTILFICLIIAYIEISGQKVNTLYLFAILIFSVLFNVNSFIVNIGEMARTKNKLVHGVILAKGGNYSLLSYPDSAISKTLVQLGRQKNIYDFPEYSYQDFLNNDINASKLNITSTYKYELNTFVNDEKLFYANGWVIDNTDNTVDNFKIFILLRSERNDLVFKTYPIRKIELKQKHRMMGVDFSIALLKNEMEIPEGNYKLFFVIQKEKGLNEMIETNYEVKF